MKRELLVSSLILFIILLSGCNTWAVRVFFRSLDRLSDPIDPAPRMITSPVVENARLAVSWIGHATVLVQVYDKIFVTDPWFTNSVGMVARRHVRPGLDPSILPKMDFTLISHLHFDHFSFGSLQQLPTNGVLVVPFGGLRYTPDFGFRAIWELEPWEAMEEDGVRVTAVPVQHFSGRYGFDGAWMRDYGYTGYIFEYRDYTIFFGGDTGYHPELFKEIGRRFDVDVAILPIGPGASWEIGSYVHVHPRGALMIFQDVNAEFMVPMHHRTLFYSDRDPYQSIQTLRQLAANMGLSERIIDLDIGEQRVLVPEHRPAVTGD